jgi:hypothetical protein
MRRIARRDLLQIMGMAAGSSALLFDASTRVVSAQDNNCTYWEFTDEQLENLIHYFIQKDLPDTHIQILQDMQNGSSRISYLYKTELEFRYDNLDSSDSVPTSFGDNIQTIEENTKGTDKFSSYFNNYGSVDCDSIPFEAFQDGPCYYYGFSDNQISNIKQWIENNISENKEVSTNLLSEIREGPATINYLYADASAEEFYFDNGDSVVTTDDTLYAHLASLHISKSKSELEDYFLSYNSVSCNRIPFEARSVLPTTTQTPTQTPTSTSTVTATVSTNPTRTSVSSRVEADSPVNTSQGETPNDFNSFLNRFLISLFSTEALVALSTAVVVVIMVVFWNKERT